MATSKGKILKEQITFDFFEEIKIQKPTKIKKEKVVVENKTKTTKKLEKVEKTKQIIFRKEKCNVKPNHIKIIRKRKNLHKK